ncbi:Initiator Replication protein [Gillisia sp. Hel1_33_143]|uniref:replication initiation protein n=1 Tax=unclassified Gillisia TaxID=2615025 RepID=UPI000555F9C9|nr:MULTISPECIES: replication initiation protein [unclassified Gillisia]SDS26278.1 Initiator Replication protein [Gillisia sp. Hel1_33_143]
MKDNFIKQPNHIFTARFTLSRLEKNIIYTILDKLQKSMKMDLNDHFVEEKVTAKLKTLDKNRNYKRIKSAVKSLGSKQVEFELNIPNGNKPYLVQENVTSLVSGLTHVQNSDSISFIIPSQASKFFCYIGGGYTIFQKTIAISLTSLYSKRLYELCCRWIDKGGYNCSIEDFKKLMSIENKYKQISHLRERVLEDSKDELEKLSDVYFSYSLRKTGRTYTTISFKFHRSLEIGNNNRPVRSEHYSYVYNFLNQYFPRYLDDKALVYSDSIANADELYTAYKRFGRLDDDLATGKKEKRDITNLLNTVILKELKAI